MPGGGIQNSGHKLKLKGFGVYNRKIFSTLSLKTWRFFKIGLDKALSHLVWLYGWSCFEQEDEWGTSWIAFQTEFSYNPNILSY